MLDVRMLGTGTPRMDPARCGSGTAITTDEGWLLVDCGRGVAQRICEAGLDVQRLQAVFLTHHHSDHVSDLASIAVMRWTAGASTPLTVICPEGPCEDFTLRCLDAFPDSAFHGQAAPDCGPRPRVEVRSFAANHALQEVFRDRSAVTSSVLVDHAPIEAAVGYRFSVGPTIIAISGDTAVCAGVELLAGQADLLIHEALRGELVPVKLLEWNASAESVGEVAQSAEVAHLVLTHLLPPPRSAQEEAAFEADARAGGFLGRISIASDHLHITTNDAHTD